MDGFSLSRALTEAFVFVPKAWAQCWLSLLLLFGLGLVALQVQFSDYGFTLWVIALVCVALMVLGGLYRAALFGDRAVKSGLGFGGIQMGGAEWRLITGGIYNIFFLVFISIFAAMFVILVASKTELASHYNNSFKTVLAAFFEPFTSEKIVIICIAAAVGVMLLSLVVGLLPYQVASVAQNKTISVNALRFSQGKMLKMVLGLGLLVSPLLLLIFLNAYMGVAIPTFAMISLNHLALVVLTLLTLPLVIGFFSSIYRQTPPSDMT